MSNDYKTIKVRLVEDENGDISIGYNKTYRIEEILDEEEKEPITKKDLETL